MTSAKLRKAPETSREDAKAKLAIRDLEKTFISSTKSVTALTDINLEVSAGEIIGLIGPSGCGKSTLLHICAGLIEATAGSAAMNGKPITEPGPDRCVVFQRVALFPHLNASQNVEYGLRLRGMAKAERRRIAEQYLDLVGLSGFGGSFPHELSGGMQQRIALARALVLEPELLLMDEPFAALDAQTRILMQELVARLAKELKLTIMLVTHNVEEAVYLANRVFVMSARPGRISEVVDVRHDLWSEHTVIDAEELPAFTESRHHLSRLVRREVMKQVESS